MMIYTIVKVSNDGEDAKELVSVTADLYIHNERVDKLFEMFSKTHSLNESHDEEFVGECPNCNELDSSHDAIGLKACKESLNFYEAE